MALIKCKECNQEVSDKAAACPKCGAPISSVNENTAAGANLKTIQETSKKFKMKTILAIITTIIGLAILMPASKNTEDETGIYIGASLTTAGLLWYIINRFRIWWHHK